MEQNPRSLEECLLCSAIADSASVKCGIENTPIFQTENFLVIPCVGPLVVGHVLVVTRSHLFSLSQVSPEAIAEYEALRDSVSHFVPGLLEAEHGATGTNCGGACVVHAHVHWIPNHSKFIDAFEGGFAKLYDGNELVLPQSSVPYMMLRANNRTVVYDGTDMISQMLRMIICSEKSVDYDWRAVPKLHLIEESISYWRK